MFAELMPLLRKRRLLLTVALVEGDTIRATVVPQKSSETEDSAITTPLAITGTAQELDRELPGQLVSFVGAHLQLQSTLATAKAEMDATAKAAREEARKKASSQPRPRRPQTHQNRRRSRLRRNRRRCSPSRRKHRQPRSKMEEECRSQSNCQHL